jgi:hypothetical protein
VRLARALHGPTRSAARRVLADQLWIGVGREPNLSHSCRWDPDECDLVWADVASSLFTFSNMSRWIARHFPRTANATIGQWLTSSTYVLPDSASNPSRDARVCVPSSSYSVSPGLVHVQRGTVLRA